MKRIFALASLAALTLAASSHLVASGQWMDPASSIPAYNQGPPKAPLPPILSGAQLSGPYFTESYQVTAYKMAAKVPGVLHQLPCYCHCDRSLGHNSLHSCFEGTHGAACSTCMKEGVYAYQQTKLGRSPAQIRASIERGDWMNVDLENAKL